MKMVLRRIAGWGAGLLVLAGLAYGAWWVVRHHLSPLLFWTYAAIAAGTFLFLGLINLRILSGSSREGLDNIVLTQGMAEIRAKRLGVPRLYLAVILEVLSVALVFPAHLVRVVVVGKFLEKIQGRGVTVRMASRDALDGPERMRAVVCVVLVALAWLWFLLTSSSGYAVLFGALVIGNPLAQMAAWNIGGVSVPQRLKAQKGSPYLRFVSLGILYGLALVGSFSLSSAWLADKPADFAVVSAAAKGLFTFEALWRVVKGQSLAPWDIALGLSALLYYLTVIRSVLRWKDFTRSTSDLGRMAAHSVVVGDYLGALRILEPVKARDADTLIARGMALLCVNQVEEGLANLEQARIALGLDRLTSFELFFGGAARFVMPGWLIAKVMNRWLDEDPEPGALMMALLGLKGLYGDRREELERFLTDPRLEDRPVHRAALLSLLDRDEEAQPLLLAAETRSDSEEVFRRLLLLPSGITPTTSRKADGLHTEAWLEEQLPEIRKLAPQLSGVSLVGAALLLAASRSLVEGVGLGREQEVAAVEEQLRRRVVEENGESGLHLLTEVERSWQRPS